MYDHVLHAFVNSPWAILPEKLAEIQAFLARRLGGAKLPKSEAKALRAAARGRDGVAMAGKTAIIGLYGVLAQRMGLMTATSGGTSTELFGQAFDSLVADPSVKSIIIDVDSPGGSVYGTGELAAKVAAGSAQKRVVAVANSLAASAAYWIASQTRRVYVTPGGQVGSIGVLAVHQDVSGKDELAGIKTTIVSAGKFKGEGDPSQPLGAEAQGAIQQTVDSYYSQFVAAVAKGRGVSPADVRAGYGQGRVLTAKAAVAEGLADEVATLEDVVRHVSGQAGGAAAELPDVAPVAGPCLDVLRRRLRLAEA